MTETVTPGLTLIETAAALRSGEFSSVDLVESQLDRIAQLDGALGAFATVFVDSAIEAADVADAERASGTVRGPLHGIPFGVKDIIAAREGVTTASSTVVKAGWWAGRDAPVVARLRSAGAIILGKTTTMEYALGEPDASQNLPMPKSAWDENRWAGGSSSGSGSGVGTGLLTAAIGTDTGGSVRLPAAFNGVTGHKPTFGLVPKSGIHVLGNTLDAVGPLAWTAADCAVILEAIAGPDASDANSIAAPTLDFSADLGTSLAGRRLGVDMVSVYSRVGVDPSVIVLFENAVRALADAGAVIVPITLPDWELARLSALVTWQADALAYHGDTVRDHWSELGHGIRRMFIEGLLVNPQDYQMAQRVRAELCRQTAEMFGGVDAVVTPTVGVGALPFDDRSGSLVDSTAFTALWSVTGYPAVSVPMGLVASGVPAGLQIATAPYRDALALGIADAYQALTAHHRSRTPRLPWSRSLERGTSHE